MNGNLVKKGLGLFAVCFLLVYADCPRRDKESAEEMIANYWQLVFEGNARKAYNMFASSSKKETTLEDYAERVAFGLEPTPAKDSFWAEYTPRCELSVGSVNIREDTAYVDVLLTIPNLSRLQRDLDLKADSLIPEADSLDREEWIMSKRVAALRKRNYMPLLMHLELKLHWERFGWYLVYE